MDPSLYDYHINTHLAPSDAKRPVRNHVFHGSEWNTDDDEDEVGTCEVDDEEVGGVAHLVVGYDDDDDAQVAHESEDGYQTEYDRDGHFQHLR